MFFVLSGMSLVRVYWLYLMVAMCCCSMVCLLFPVAVVLQCVLHLLVLALLQGCWLLNLLLVLKLLLEPVVLDSVFASWYVERVFVVRSVYIRLVSSCGFQSICLLLQYILGMSILVFQCGPIYILLACEYVVGRTCSDCPCRPHSYRMVLAYVVVQVLMEWCLVVFACVVSCLFLFLLLVLVLTR